MIMYSRQSALVAAFWELMHTMFVRVALCARDALQDRLYWPAGQDAYDGASATVVQTRDKILRLRGAKDMLAFWSLNPKP